MKPRVSILGLAAFAVLAAVLAPGPSGEDGAGAAPRRAAPPPAKSAAPTAVAMLAPPAARAAGAVRTTPGHTPSADATLPPAAPSAPASAAVTAATSASAPPAAVASSAAAPTAAASAPAAVRAPIDPDAGRGLIAGAPPPPPPPPAPPPRPAPPPPAPPPAPEGPPLRIVGVVRVGSPEPLAFFALGDYLMQGRKGDVIDERFRIDDITGKSVVVTVLPTMRRMELPITTGG